MTRTDRHVGPVADLTAAPTLVPRPTEAMERALICPSCRGGNQAGGDGGLGRAVRPGGRLRAALFLARLDAAMAAREAQSAAQI